jgi:NAD(P)H dehydrogenase (quinone)
MLIVTGATGRLGSLVVDRLLERVPAEKVGVSVRDTGKASALAARGVRVRAGDFTDPASLQHAFEGADRVLVVSAAIRGDGALVANCAAIDAAQRAGAHHIVYTSHQAASPTSLFPPQTVHAATEEHLKQTGVPFTALRNGFYTSTLAHHIGSALTTGNLAVPQDGPVSWTAHEDLAEAAAITLADGTLKGITPPLTAPGTLDFADVADILSKLTGRTISRTVVDEEEWKARAIADGLPPQAAEFSLRMFAAAREGEFNVTDPALETIIDHPARTVESVLRALVNNR